MTRKGGDGACKRPLGRGEWPRSEEEDGQVQREREANFKGRRWPRSEAEGGKGYSEGHKAMWGLSCVYLHIVWMCLQHAVVDGS